VYFPYGFLTDCFVTQALKLREAIYFHAARQYANSADATNITAAVNEAYLELVRKTEAEVSEGAAVRGNLSSQTNRVIILLTDALPPLNEEQFSQALKRLEDARVKLLIVAFAHSALAPDQVELLLARASEYRARGSEVLQVFSVRSAEELTAGVLPKLIALGREVALRS
jgi:N-methylhydantoinase A/oxoprolinase/acetone carboxylase beta subunit